MIYLFRKRNGEIMGVSNPVMAHKMFTMKAGGNTWVPPYLGAVTPAAYKVAQDELKEEKQSNKEAFYSEDQVTHTSINASNRAIFQKKLETLAEGADKTLRPRDMSRVKAMQTADTQGNVDMLAGYAPKTPERMR